MNEVAEKGLQAVAASGESMGPRYAGVASFLIRSANPETVAPGTVVVMQRGTVPVAHRLLGRFRWKGQRWLVTRGDGNAFIDAPWMLNDDLKLQEALAMEVDHDWVSLDGFAERVRGKGLVLKGWLLIVRLKLTGRSLYSTTD